MDYCSYVKPYSNMWCRDAANQLTGTKYRSVKYGMSGSRCLEGNLLLNGWSPLSNFAADCFQTRCVGQTLEVQVGSTFYACGNGNTLTVSGYQGGLTCPTTTEQATALCPPATTTTAGASTAATTPGPTTAATTVGPTTAPPPTTVHMAPTTLALTTVPGLSAQQKLDLLSSHNTKRTIVSPTASKMMELLWDSNLESVAQNYAGQCYWGHNPNRNTQAGESVGENLAAWSGSSPATYWVDMWDNEKVPHGMHAFFVTRPQASQAYWSRVCLFCDRWTSR